MYLHLGQETTINIKNVVGIFDLDTSSVSKKTREFLNRAEKEKRVVYTSNELPKSFVLAVGKNMPVYVSQLSSATLKGRVAQQKKSQLNK